MSKQLNTGWMVATFITVLSETSKGGFAVLDKTWDEVAELKRLTYIKAAPSKHKNGNEIAFTAQKDAHVEDLINDLDLNLSDFIDQIPAELRKMTNENAQVPQAPVFEQNEQAPAPAPVYPVDNEDGGEVDAAPQAPVAADLQPQFSETAQAPAATDAADAPQVDYAPVIGENVTYGVLDKVETQIGELDIEVGIPFKQTIKKASQPKAGSIYPFATLAEQERAHPNTAPSFHLKDKILKNMSASLRRACITFEESHGVTFRGRNVGADDPKGEGVRIFALQKDAVPARRSSKPAQGE